MTTRTTPHDASRNERGAALLIALLVVVVMVTLAAALMTSAAHESQESAAAGETTRLLYVTEAGINHAIADLAVGGSGNLGSSTSPVGFGGGTFWVQALDNGDGSYTVTSNGRSAGEAEAIEVVVAQIPSSLFTKGLFGDLDIGASGNVFTDSYDSDLGTYAGQATNVHLATGHIYAGTNGSLASNGNITLRGGVTILGDATPGPGGTVTISGGGVHVEGSTAPATSPTPLPPVEYSPPIGAAGSYSLSGGAPTMATGTLHYTAFNLSGATVLTIQGDVVLYVDGNFDVSGTARIVIDPGASLKIYHAGGSFKLAGNGLLNRNEKASEFKVLSRAATVQIRGTSAIHGAVYAPDAVITPSGTSQICGSFVGREIYVGGTADFHYDEALARDDSSPGRKKFDIRSWRIVGAGTL